MNHLYEIPSVTLRRSYKPFMAAFLGITSIFLLLHHLDILATHQGDRRPMEIWTATFAISTIQLHYVVARYASYGHPRTAEQAR